MLPSYEIPVERVRWVSLFRALIGLVSLVLVIYWQTKIETIGDIKDFFKILVFVFGLSLIYGTVLIYLKRVFVLGLVQIFLDYLIIGFIVAKTGGIDSPFIFFYVFPVIESGMFFGKNGCYLATFFNLFFLGLGFVLQYNKVFPYRDMPRYVYAKEDFFYYYSIFSLGFLVLGLLIAYLNSETRKFKERLKKSEDRYLDMEQLKSAIIQAIDSGLVIITKEKVIYPINDLAKKIITKLAFNEKDIGVIFKNEINTIFENQEPQKVEKKINYNNNNFFISASLVPLYEHSGELLGVLISFSDITERKFLEEQIRIKDKFTFLGKLSTVIAHEIKNPLASIKGSINFVKDSIQGEGDINRLLDISSKELDRLNKVINDFLFYSRYAPLEIGNIYIKNLLDEIWFELIFSSEDKDRLNFVFEGEDLIFKGDPNQMRQVFLNLFLNSLDVLREKGGGNIYVRVRNEGDKVLIDFEDDGGGVKEEYLDKIFDPFFSTKKNGTGLGLAIVYKIIEEHKGQIHVSNTERGAKFTIRFEK
ncbi:MAG: ATP-binding protein [Proteobacteria bacterium]|nr:ATP-binding protein [Pseudomonadota bacterium]